MNFGYKPISVPANKPFTFYYFNEYIHPAGFDKQEYDTCENVITFLPEINTII